MCPSKCCRYRYPYLPLTFAFFGTSVITTTQPFAGSARRSSNFSAPNRIQSASPLPVHKHRSGSTRPDGRRSASRATARERHDVIDDEAPAPILLGHLNMGRRARSPCAILVWLEALERPVNTPIQNISGLPQGLAGI